MERSLFANCARAAYRWVASWWLVSLSLGMFPPIPVAHAAEEAARPTAVQENMDVGLDYTLTVEGKVVDSTDGKSPLHYIHGRGQIIPGLERQLVGLHVGDSKEVTVDPKDGYGPLDPAAIVEVKKDQLPKDITPSAGMVLRGVNPDGRSFRASVKAVKDTTVLLDLNHPLAGKTLVFKVKITDIKPAPAAPASPAPPAAPSR